MVEVVRWDKQQQSLCSIRNKVFVEEQQVPAELESDGQDVHATHFLLTRAGVALGCGRLLPDGKIGRMAILQEQRGLGLGKLLLEAMVKHAKRHGFTRLYLHAQSYALGFYQSCGFSQLGTEFTEAGIAHVAMEQLVDYSDADQFISGVSYPQPFATLALQLARTAKRSLRIYSHELDRVVFDDAELASALVALIKRSRISEVRILVNDARPMTQHDHRLLNLARRLSSSIHIRVLAEHPQLPDATFVVRDDDGTLYQPDDRELQGFYEPGSRASAKRFVEQFDYLWQSGERDPYVSTLRL